MTPIRPMFCLPLGGECLEWTIYPLHLFFVCYLFHSRVIISDDTAIYYMFTYL